MTDSPGAVAPYPGNTVSGEVIQPAQVQSAKASLGHDFFNVLRHIIKHGGAYHDQGTQSEHLNVVDRYEANQAGREARNLLTEDDPAPVRNPDFALVTSGVPAPPPAAANLDYNKLAAAIVAVQQAQSEQASPPAEDGKA